MIANLKTALSRIIVDQEELVNGLIIALLTDSHLLIESLPGMGKTLSVKTLANLCHLKFQRIQFTPDLLPSDLIGTLVFNQQTSKFETRKGPLFSNLVLADEINRAPAKVQSALLEAMEERQVTIGKETYPLDKPFIVFATQNPIEQEGVYNLPEAQLDRFSMKLVLTYPSEQSELEVLDLKSWDINSVWSNADLEKSKVEMDKVVVNGSIKEYIIKITRATRKPSDYNIDGMSDDLITFGSSVRGAKSLLLASKAMAYVNGKDFVSPLEVKFMAKPCLRHRIGLNYTAQVQNVSQDAIIESILSTIPLP